MENTNSEGLTAYDILKIQGCPYTLPTARSMTQATIDYKHLEPTLFKWFEDNKEALKGLYIDKQTLK